MNTTKKIFIVLGVIIAVTGLWLLYVFFALGSDSEANNTDIDEPITNFEECIDAGNPAMESYPRQCSANGETFVEEIDGQTQDNTGNATLTYTSDEGTELTVDVSTNELITSPFAFTGEVPGSWSFEATFPIEIQDANRQTVAEHYAQLEGDWMTEEKVPFEATISFETPQTKEGFLILHKDNPSGLPENDDSVTIPVMFSEN